MAKGGGKGDPGKYPSLFGERAPQHQMYGPGEADYITVPFDIGGPLIDPSYLFMRATGSPPGRKRDIEELEGTKRKGRGGQLIPDKPSMKAPSRYASADNGIRSDAMAMATPSTAGAKANATPEANDPLSMLMEAFMSLFNGTVPSPGMGGGETIMAKGEQSPFVQMPTEMDLPQRNPFFETTNDERILAEMLRGPGNSVQMTNPGPLQREGIRAAQAQAEQTMAPPPAPLTNAPTLNPPVPEANPAFHSSGGPDLRSIGVLLEQMFNPQGATKGMVPMPQRNPMFTGGI